MSSEMYPDNRTPQNATNGWYRSPPAHRLQRQAASVFQVGRNHVRKKTKSEPAKLPYVNAPKLSVFEGFEQIAPIEFLFPVLIGVGPIVHQSSDRI